MVSEPYERVMITINANPSLASQAAKVIITRIMMILNCDGAPKMVAAKIMVIRVVLSRANKAIRRWRR